MTALAGYWGFAAAGDPRRACERMLQAQRIYASEPGLCWSLDRVAVGRALYRLLPEDGYDKGPVVGADGSVLVADLRIDNRAELAAALGLEPAELRTLSDAALLMRCLERWDEGALERVVGDFAFAWWQPARRRLLLARDYLGQRPLHYHRGDGFLAFASMPKGLHALAEIPRAPALAATAEFLALLPETPGASFFEGIESVPAGHVVTAGAEEVAARRYWHPDLSPLRLRGAGEYEEGLREVLDAAVDARLRGAPAKVAAHLSAGLDSSAVAATAARAMAPSGGRVFAFTSVPRSGYRAEGLPNAIWDEEPLAAAVASLYPNIEHILIRGSQRSAVDGLDRHFHLYDRPVLNVCNATWSDAINDAAKARGLPIMLTGQMGNMGLSHSGMAHLPQLLSRGRLLRFARTALALTANGVRWGTVASQSLGPFLPRPLWRAVKRARGKGGDVFGHSAVSVSAVAEHDLRGAATARGFDFGYRPKADGVAQRLTVLRRVDPGNYGKGALAGWGIDQRDPTADRRLIEYCLRVPEEEYLRGGMPRGLARRALADRLPAVLLGERLKGYQAADWHESLSAAREAVREEVGRISANPEASGILDTERMTRLVEEWPEGQWHKSQTTRQYRQALLRGISVGHFVRKATGSNQ